MHLAPADAGPALAGHRESPKEICKEQIKCNLAPSPSSQQGTNSVVLSFGEAEKEKRSK